MLDRLRYQGIDGSGQWREGGTGMVHQMRWTTPESTRERLPLVRRGGALVVSGDVRIDNRDDLLATFDVPVGERSGWTDVDVVAEAYERWGIEAPCRLLGDFSFAVWDREARRLLCARDPMGVRPLLYVRRPEIFAFASEAKAFLAIPDIPRELDDVFLADLVAYPIFPIEGERSFLDAAEWLSPGHRIVIEDGRFRGPEPYWTVDDLEPVRIGSELEFVEALRQALFEAVRCRIRSEQPVAVSLSGGLDSSPLAAIAARIEAEKGRRITAVSAVLPKGARSSRKDERTFIEETVAYADLDAVYVTAEGRSPYQGMEPDHVATELIAERRFYLNQELHAATRGAGCRILVKGNGGEFGPSAYPVWFLRDMVRERAWRSIGREMAHAARQGPRRLLGLLWHELVSGRPYQPMQGGWLEFLPDERARSTDAARRQADAFETMLDLERVRGRLERRRALIDQTRRWEGMGASAYDVDTVDPFLDLRVLALCLHLPWDRLVRDGTRRLPIRWASEGLVPESVRWRTSKRAFSPDYFDRMVRFRGEAMAWIDAASGDPTVGDYVDLERLRSAIRDELESVDIRAFSRVHAIHNSYLVARFVHWLTSDWMRPR